MASWFTRILGRKAEPLHQATLVINGWMTSCSRCGKRARAEEKFHERNHAGKPNGCGARFTAFTIVGNPSLAEIEGHRRVRQDIPYVSTEELDSTFQVNNPPLTIYTATA